MNANPIVQVIKVPRVEADMWPWRRRAYFIERGVPDNLLTKWILAGDIRAKKSELGSRQAALFLRVEDVLEKLEGLPDVVRTTKEETE